ncbi:uncharacterized protein C8R40DRAFT_1070490 [Lentinula edodes]|uniref:uncharacterized protein n=1 Tax=Lentinula edodes TaxID=5353 RepID=UPI001E8D343D|nr:uncharacterized protein C8R40DRAFT_1070490 [Lentinula edodes]KAH7873988.1 hypothetical protein C8R40DRAFT_1070490 [Lentinula edodes]
MDASPVFPSNSANPNATLDSDLDIPVFTPALEIDSIDEFPMIPSGRNEYLKRQRQGGRDELIEHLDALHSASEKIYNDQKEEIQRRRRQISVLKEECSKLQETICLSKLTQEREHWCPGCHDLAWNPHMPPIPSFTIQHAIEDIALKVGKVSPVTSNEKGSRDV